MDSTDCGPTCIRIISSYYGRKISHYEIHRHCHISRDGISLLSINNAAKAIGFRTTCIRLSFQQLCNETKFPCIIHWNQNHFVVVYKVKSKGTKTWIYISDPAYGLLKYDKIQFIKSWISTYHESDYNTITNLGVVLLLEPTKDFYREKEHYCKDDKVKLTEVYNYLKPHKRYIIQLIITLITGSLISFTLPFLTQLVIDIGIDSGNLNFIIIILIAQIVMILGQMSNELVRRWLMLHVTSRIGISLISNYLINLMMLPISFFESRMTGDIMQRIEDHGRIQSFLTSSLLSIIMTITAFIVYAIIIGGYDMTILTIFVIGSTLHIAWGLIFLKQRRKINYMRFHEMSSCQNNIMQLINGIQDIKISGCEKQKRWKWEQSQVRLFGVYIKDLKLNQIQQIGGAVIDQTKNLLISFYAASAVINGQLTLGMMTAMQYIIGQFNLPISQFLEFIQDAQDAKISLERINEIHSYTTEEEPNKNYIMQIPEKADIEFKNVTFQYNRHDHKKTLNNICIKIPHDKVTAIVGASGSGKSTIIKMMLGFYKPTSGTILIGDYPINNYSLSSWRKQCSAVMQEGFIFSDTIANNIGISDDIPDIYRIYEASKIANIEDFIGQLPLKYDTKIGIEGNGISIGQKQRLFIARAAYRKSKYLFLDEATNSIDADNEKIIIENLNTLFKNKTVVVIAHRLSTVINADNIIVLDNGQVIEQGTHKQLIKLKGYYYKLVSSQLYFNHQ